MRKAWRAWRTRSVETRSVIERVVRSKPLSEAIVWIKRSVVMKPERAKVSQRSGEQIQTQIAGSRNGM